MDKRIIYQNDEGGVAVIIPIVGATKPATEEQLQYLKSRIDEHKSTDFETEVEELSDRAELEAEIAAVRNATFTLEEIAAKDVPTGRPYKIVDAADVPTDRSARYAWTVDEADLTDGVGA
jgi:hypothetical protein